MSSELAGRGEPLEARGGDMLEDPGGRDDAALQRMAFSARAGSGNATLDDEIPFSHAAHL